MSTLINTYPVFEDNQVLTSSQLNEMQGYLEQQNRLTRTNLIGIGVVCGMDLVCALKDGKLTLTITKGVGVTSQGYLITIGKCETTQYRPYIKPDTVSYPPFEDSDGEQDIELLELLTDEAEVDEEDTVTPLSKADEISEEENFPEDYVVLLFLECYDKDLKSCLGKSCDELGIDRIMTLRKLLISKSDLEKVKGRTSGGMLQAAYPDKYVLPKLSIRRPHLNAASATSLYYIGIAAEYLQAITEVSRPLFNALHLTYKIYQPILKDSYATNPFEKIDDKTEQLEKYLEFYSSFSKPVYGIQYFYDFMKDLILAYEEFRLAAFELRGACCPDRRRFPKHLMLGEACAESSGLCEKVHYRNEFVSSPAFSEHRDLSEKVKMLHKRLVLMLESFDLGRLRESKQWNIKITPSSEKQSFISERAIPFYYNSKKESSFDGLGTLEENWNFDLQRQCRNDNAKREAGLRRLAEHEIPGRFERIAGPRHSIRDLVSRPGDGDQPLQLSYDNHQPNSDREGPIIKPLNYNLDPYNFLRIEGHVGKPLGKVEADIQKIKDEKDLSFDVKKLYIGYGPVSTENTTIPDCLIEDLQPQYSIWRNKMLLFVKNLVQTSKTAERIIHNRHMLGAEKEYESYRAKNATFAGMGNFNMADFTNVFMGVEPEKINQSANRLYEIMNNFKRAGSSEYAARTAAYESSTDTSIRQLFSSLNNCLHQLIDAMPRDFQEFEMKTWVSAYKCTLRVIIHLMKWIASNATTALYRNQAFLYLVYINLFYRVVSFFAIYPYITIRTLYDTYRERGQAWAKSLQLHQFRKNHPGLQHKAGVAPGQTFLLVYQSGHYGYFLDEDHKKIEEDMLDYFDIPFASDNADLNFDRYLNATERMEGRVVADFTLPFTCCDDCEDVPSEAVTLDPLASPVARMVMPKGGLNINGYESIEIQLINDLYDPEIYQASLDSRDRAKFGSTMFREEPYEPDNSKTKQILVYDVDLKKLYAEMQRTDAFFIIDEFSYQIKDINRNEIVGSDAITIFIPVDRQTKPQTGRVTGTVEANNKPLQGAKVYAKGTQRTVTANANGYYMLAGVPVGKKTLVASFIGYGSEQQQINVTTGANSANFVLKQIGIVDIDYGPIRRAHGLEGDTPEVKNLKKHYSTRMNAVKKTADDIVKMEGKEEQTPLKKAADSVKEFTDKKEMNVVRLNNEYNKRRNELITEIQNKKGAEKELHKAALKNTTKAYLNRLAYTQPKDFSSTTKDVLNESATIFNAEEDLDMKKTIADWKKNAKGYVTEDFENNLNNNFKLK